jgi:hypothetical protein
MATVSVVIIPRALAFVSGVDVALNRAIPNVELTGSKFSPGIAVNGWTFSVILRGVGFSMKTNANLSAK